MAIRPLTAIIAFFLCSSQGYGEEFHSRYWAQDQDTKSLEEDIEEPDELFEQETPKVMPARQGHVQFTMEPFGFAVYPIPSYGAQIAYLWSNQWGTEFIYSFGNADIYERQVKIEKTSMRFFSMLPFDFRASAGMGVRNVRSEPLPSGDQGEQSSVSQLMTDILFGKNWLTETFIVAIDFWGVAIPMRQLRIRGEDLRNTADSSADTKKFSNMQHGLTYQAFRFRFGIEF